MPTLSPYNQNRYSGGSGMGKTGQILIAGTVTALILTALVGKGSQGPQAITNGGNAVATSFKASLGK